MTDKTESPASPTSDGRDEPPTACVSAALLAARHSRCRSKRGVVIFVDGRVIVAGFNHRPDGGCDGSDACKATCRTTAVHAEQDALIRAGRAVVGAEMLHVKINSDGQLDISGPPSCAQCSKLILRAGITRMWLFSEAGWTSYSAGVFHDMSVTADKDAALRTTLAQKDEEIKRLKSQQDKAPCVSCDAPATRVDVDGFRRCAMCGPADGAQ